MLRGEDQITEKSLWKKGKNRLMTSKESVRVNDNLFTGMDNLDQGLKTQTGMVWVPVLPLLAK